jgi:hypothetical protein
MGNYIVNMGNFLIAATPGGIEAQEAQGQREFVANETLPIDCPKAELEALGFVFGAPVDDLFVSVQFPTGWEKIATDHSMWSDLVDEAGVTRGSIFYKAAFYDRRAFMRLRLM